MRRFPTYLSYSELEYLAMLLEEDAHRKGFHERASLERMRTRLTRTMEMILADEALDVVITGLMAAVKFQSTCGGELWWETL